MLLGWLRRRKMEQQELAELREFADDMCQCVEDMSLLMDLMEQEEVPVYHTDFIKPKYFEADWSGGRIAVPYPMPAPQITGTSYKDHLHCATVLGARLVISDQEFMFRRSPQDARALLHMIRERLEHALCAEVSKNLKP